MFCPQCGADYRDDELKFCKSCGANLSAVRQAVATRGADEKFDWGKTWVAEMFLSEAERKTRAQELERRRGITPEVKRYNEMKAGVITGFVGIGVAIFLYVIAEGLILSGQVPPNEVEVFRRLWIIGVIPLMVGLALLINGLFVSKRLVEVTRKREGEGAASGPDALEAGARRPTLRPADTAEFIPSDFSVTEETTKHLKPSGPKS